jgi:hypothetical protein
VLTRLSALPLALAALLALSGCPAGSGSPDAGPPDAGVGPGGGDPDAGEVDAGDGKCTSSATCAANLYCNVASGECLPAKGCTDDLACLPAPGDEDYCIYGRCYCDLERNGGTCLPRIGRCEPCTKDAECGQDRFAYDNYVARCATYNGARVCLPLKASGCGRGYLPSQTTEFCEPGGGSCENAQLCSGDADCDETSRRPVCGTGGFCVPACNFDYSTGQSSCPGGQVCHVDPRLMTPGNRNFGGGKCGPPCDSGEAPYACPAGYACEADGDPLLVNVRPTRCRPPLPRCVRSPDCPAVPADNSLGWCDPATLECRSGCRDARDCVSGFKCVSNQCTQETCIEQRGANYACGRGEYCCGESGSVAPCATGVAEGSCYAPPRPLWCGGCTGTIATPSGNRPLPSACIPVEKGDGTKTTLSFHSCDTTNPASCPRVMTCKPSVVPCVSDADCGGAANSCADVEIPGPNEGDPPALRFKGCSCQGGGACPAGATCDAQSGACLAPYCTNFIPECFPL